MRDAAFPLLASSIERPLKTELSPLIKKRRRAQRCPPLLTARLRRTTALRTESTIMIAAPHCPLFPNRATIMYIVRCLCDGPSVRSPQQLRARYSLQNRPNRKTLPSILYACMRGFGSLSYLVSGPTGNTGFDRLCPKMYSKTHMLPRLSELVAMRAQSSCHS